MHSNEFLPNLVHDPVILAMASSHMAYDFDDFDFFGSGVSCRIDLNAPSISLMRCAANLWNGGAGLNEL